MAVVLLDHRWQKLTDHDEMRYGINIKGLAY
jgi:hypothetical protein